MEDMVRADHDEVKDHGHDEDPPAAVDAEERK